jgi:RNA polymerase sigma-70 factor (ECF subfamily)
MGRGPEGFLRATMPAMDLVYNVARRVTDGPEDAEDLVQETYLAAFRAWSQDRRPDRPEPWLATICLNLARSRARSRRRRPAEVALEALEPPVAGVEDEVLARLERLDLHRAMQQLTDGQRVAIALVDLGGLSTHEAASVMGVPRGTVLSRLHRGRRALAQVLAAEQTERRER